MNVAVVESDGGIRCVLSAFLQEDGYVAKDYRSIPSCYDGIDLVIFGPTMDVPQDHLEVLTEKNIPCLQLEYFADMDKLMEDVARFAHTEQSILEDRAV